APEPEPASEEGAGGAQPEQGQAGGAAAEQPPDKPQPSGRPAILMGPVQEIKDKTFGSTPGAVLKLAGKSGTITLKIPEFALYTAANVTWRIGKERIKTKHPVLGDIAQM